MIRKYYSMFKVICCIDVLVVFAFATFLTCSALKDRVGEVAAALITVLFLAVSLLLIALSFRVAKRDTIEDERTKNENKRFFTDSLDRYAVSMPLLVLRGAMRFYRMIPDLSDLPDSEDKDLIDSEVKESCSRVVDVLSNDTFANVLYYGYATDYKGKVVERVRRIIYIETRNLVRSNGDARKLRKGKSVKGDILKRQKNTHRRVTIAEKEKQVKTEVRELLNSNTL